MQTSNEGVNNLPQSEASNEPDSNFPCDGSTPSADVTPDNTPTERQILGLNAEFASFPAGQDITPLVLRLEQAAASESIQPDKALLHYLAASALTRSDRGAWSEAETRALVHVETARTMLIDWCEQDYRAKFWAVASLRARLWLARRSFDADVVGILEACEEAIAMIPVEESAMAAPLAYNAGMLAAGSHILGRRQASARAEMLFRSAFDRYQVVGSSERMADAAEKLSELLLERLEAAPTGAADQAAMFQEAWRFAEFALAETGADVAPARRGSRNELAALVLLKRPGRSWDDNGVEAGQYLDRALQHYSRQEPDSAGAARCAALIIEIMDSNGPPWSAKQAARYEYYLDIVSPATGDLPAGEVAARSLMAANAWIKVDKADENRAKHIRLHAERALGVAVGPDLAPQRASALLQLGNLRLNAGDLNEACDTYQQAVDCVRTSDERRLKAQALRRLTLALIRRLTESGDVALLDRTIASLRDAASLSDGEERAHVLLNLANVLIWARRNGLDASGEAIRAAIREAEAEAGGSHLVKQEVERLGPTAANVDLIDETLYDDLSSSTGPIYYRIYYHKWITSQQNQEKSTILTLLLLPRSVEPSDGVLSLSLLDGEVTAELETPCPACGARQHFTVPILASLAAGTRSAVRVAGRMVQGDVRCSACDTALQVQSFFGLDEGEPDRYSIVYPDAFFEDVTHTTGPSAIVLLQNRLIMALRKIWTGSGSDNIRMLPWKGVPVLEIIDSAKLSDTSEMVGLSEVVFGFMTGDTGRLRSGLTHCMHIFRAGVSVPADTVRTALESFALATGTAAPGADDVAACVDTIDSTLKLVRSSGLEVFFEKLERMDASSRAEGEEIEAAMHAASDMTTRRAVLNTYLKQAPDYSSDREQALIDLYYSGAELELAAMAAKGVRDSDPVRYANAEALVRGALQFTRDMIDTDKLNNSSVPAKKLLRDALDGKRHFVLILRAFDVDVPITQPSEVIMSMVSEHTDARIGWRAYSLNPNGGSTAHVVDWLASHFATLLVVNAIDPHPPKRTAKLYMTNAEWRRFVFPLIGEAAAVVMVLPPEGSVASQGVSEELRAIHRLRRSGDTVVVLSKPAEPSLLDGIFTADASPRRAGVRLGAEQLRELGFAAILKEEELAADETRLISALTDICSRTRHTQ